MNPLEWLIAQETMREILEALTPTQLSVAAMRADGMGDAEIAELFGITHQAVTSRMKIARRRIVRHVPDARDALRGRRRWGQLLDVRED